jgi:hypothetical protein
MDRFDLENAITDLYSTSDEVAVVLENLESIDSDEIYNCLIGVKKLHELRCKKLFNIFEIMLKQKLISNNGEKCKNS